ncbi:cobyrinate a,c-diamide synthase [Aureimonas pseudogalii]|uniref:Hydrogenobyrinate a,c-diamide synthase n=1 Tax=Aureimonas pseudogalii TaxID=1744844 RepID=A0A7W6H6W7_9HYPH|nr:cobyrinate a,c-diamide synthase [Aureimonas pseudogalii]MBB3999651.1 cobyrinic acid a,c-diamide synthase [Aureimonas pseudogalii]
MSDRPAPPPSHARPGFLLAAPHSGSGKTLATLALLRWLARRGVEVAPAKAGPDYIDPAFHAAASGRSSVNLDPWAMRPALLRRLAGSGDRPLVVEGMMGLFDGAADGTGSAADLAVLLGLPVVLVIDCARQSHSVAALVRGFRDHRADVVLGGLILNRVGSARHEAMLRAALEPLGLPVLVALPARADLALPERHLGLVQAGETEGLEAFLERAADGIGEGLDEALLMRLLAGPGRADADLSGTQGTGSPAATPLTPLGQRIAVARDVAFAFAYPHLLDGWQAAGAELSFFSPLADEGPAPDADAVFLPGGYPELHAGRLADAAGFRAGVHAAAVRGARIYGECGGYMALGETLEDADGKTHAMLGLLPLATSFRLRRRHLGYRRLSPLEASPWAHPLTAHEFHYATVLREGEADRLFAARDALGADLGAMGLARGRVAGSFLHVVDRGAA